jgi:hypothetical protein
MNAMTAPKRIFTVETQPRGPFPLLIGIEGPPGGGKTLSALRLAKGIQDVRGGPIVVVDTEAGRSAMYHAQIPFHLVRFNPPFRPDHFLEAVRQQLPVEGKPGGQVPGPAAIIVDSLSDEHEGAGGVLEWHDEEIDRRLGDQRDNWQRREAMGMAGWIKPKAARNAMVNGFLRITTPLIFTFRAREKTKPVKDERTGKVVPTKIGYQAIAPAEILHAMTLVCLLPPHAEGKPVWRSESAGEDFLLKWPNFLQSLTGTGVLDETIGERLARWSMGGGILLAAADAAVAIAPSPDGDHRDSVQPEKLKKAILAANAAVKRAYSNQATGGAEPATLGTAVETAGTGGPHEPAPAPPPDGAAGASVASNSQQAPAAAASPEPAQVTGDPKDLKLEFDAIDTGRIESTIPPGPSPSELDVENLVAVERALRNEAEGGYASFAKFWNGMPQQVRAHPGLKAMRDRQLIPRARAVDDDNASLGKEMGI